MVWTATGPLHRGARGYYDEHRHWHEETPLLDDSARVLPETVPDAWIASHRAACRCEPCSRRTPAELRKIRASARPRG